MTTMVTNNDSVPTNMNAFIDILNRTWFDEEGFDDEGDEDGLLLLEHIPLPADPVLAQYVSTLIEEFRAYVLNDHMDPDNPDRSGEYFRSQAQDIIDYCTAHPERQVPYPTSTVCH